MVSAAPLRWANLVIFLVACTIHVLRSFPAPFSASVVALISLRQNFKSILHSAALERQPERWDLLLQCYVAWRLTLSSLLKLSASTIKGHQFARYRKDRNAEDISSSGLVSENLDIVMGME
jgi:hypothetical protein